MSAVVALRGRGRVYCFERVAQDGTPARRAAREVVVELESVR